MSNSLLHFITRIRQNHALEHATIHVLSGRQPELRLAGRADHSGFYLIGTADLDAVADAAQTALQRLQAGEARLALHPNCGTNLVTAAGLAGSAAVLAFVGTRNTRERLERLPMLISLLAGVLMFAQPLGMSAQKHITTCAWLDDVHLVDVQRSGQFGLWGHPVPVYHVRTR